MDSNKFIIAKEVRKLLPIYADKYIIYELTNRDKQWYIKQIAQPYFNMSIKNKFSQSNAVKNAYKFIDAYMNMVEHDINNCCQIRTIIKDLTTDTLVGGVTVFYKAKYSVIELGYWIVPNYQGNGIMSCVLRKFLISLSKNLDTSLDIHLEIFDSNEPQKCLAEKNHFFEMIRKTCDTGDDILVYKLDRKKFIQKNQNQVDWEG